MLISENFGELLEPGLRKVFVDQFKQMTSMLDVVFNMQNSDKAVAAKTVTKQTSK